MSHEDDLARFAARRMAAAEKNTAENASVTLGAKITREMVVNGPLPPVPHPLTPTPADTEPFKAGDVVALGAGLSIQPDPVTIPIDPPIVKQEKKKRGPGRPKASKSH